MSPTPSTPVQRSVAQVLAALLLLSVAALARADGAGAPGINPKDNITKGEVFLKSDRLGGGASLQALAVKYDMAFNASSGANVEVPLIRVTAAGSTSVGLGDVAMRVRHVVSSGPWSVIAAAEFVAPTASKNELGSGKWQVNPAAGVVYALSPTSFVYAGYRHVLSVAGDDNRQDISDMQPRALFARVWQQGYWVLADVKYTRSLKGSRSEALDLELEGGKMLSADLGAWVRVGTSRMDSPRHAGLLVGMRRIW